MGTNSLRCVSQTCVKFVPTKNFNEEPGEDDELVDIETLDEEEQDRYGKNKMRIMEFFEEEKKLS